MDTIPLNDLDGNVFQYKLDESRINYENYLFATSSKLILSNLDRFLYKLSKNEASKFYINKNQYFPPKLVNQIGQGSLGSVYDVGDRIIKVTNVCGRLDHPVQKEICNDMLKGDTIIKVPTSWNNKKILLMPNMIGEAVIQIILNSKNPSFTTRNGFPKLYGFEIDDEKKQTYSSMEKLRPWLPKFSTSINYGEIIGNKLVYNNFRTLKYSLFQIAYSLLSAQVNYRFTHYDLHTGNVMTRPKSLNTIHEYIFDDRYIYTLYDFETVIIDFGWARIETDKYIITPKIKFINRSDVPDLIIDLLNLGEFNPVYDITSILGSLYVNTDESKVTKETQQFFLQIYSCLFNEQLDENNIIDILKYNYIPKIKSDLWIWRPNPNKITTKEIDGRQMIIPESMDIFIKNLVTLIESEQNDIFSPLEHLIGGGMYVSKERLNFPEEYKIKQFWIPNDINAYKQIYFSKGAILSENIPNGMSVCHDTMTFFQYNEIFSVPVNIEYLKWAKTHTEGIQKGMLNYKDQRFSIIKINTEKALSMGFTFNFTCCRVDIFSYMRSYSIESGMAVNASYFKIRDNFVPIGYYKTNDLYFNEKIPSKYKNFYCSVCITNEGYLVVDYTLDDYYLRNTYPQYISCGPVIIKDGQRIINEQTIMAKDNEGAYLFQCHTAKDVYIVSDGEGKIKNCNTITPGDLLHIGNPNPRTILAYHKNSPRDPHFFYFEGRDQRGPGIDLVLASYYLHSKGYDHAINLDGGLSSQMIWKNDHQGYIYRGNPFHNYVYPVGNVISCVRKID